LFEVPVTTRREFVKAAGAAALRASLLPADSRAGAMSCLTGIAIRNSIDQKRAIRIADLVKV
jgi:hypothetical protein